MTLALMAVLLLYYRICFFNGQSIGFIFYLQYQSVDRLCEIWVEGLDFVGLSIISTRYDNIILTKAIAEMF